MKELVLKIEAQNKYKKVIVDDEDFEQVDKNNWRINRFGYAYRHTMRKGVGLTILMHRVIMNAPEGVQIDHINGDPLDNRRVNLRQCSIKQNARNQKIRKNNKYGFKGVTLRENGKYQARIRVDYKCISLGCFDTVIEAAKAYNQAALKHFGEFARVNPISS